MIVRIFASGTFDAESSLRRLGGQDSSLGNIEGFDYDGSDGFRIKGSFTRFQYYGLPRHAENYKLSRSKLGLGGMNIRLHSNLGTDTLRKSIGIQNVPYGNILENDLLTYDVIIPRLNLKNGFENEIINNKYNFAISNISRYRDEKKIEVVEKFSYKYEDFDKDEKEAIGKSHLFGNQKDFARTKKDEEEEDLKYDKNESAAKELSSESHGKNESHKKGHKTSGFHNVYHKDEYKKDMSFYDNKHVDEHEASCSSENNEHEEAKGEQKNIQKLDAGYHRNEQAQKKVFLNGHRYRTAQGQDREASGKEHYVENAEFLKKDEQSATKVEDDSLYLEKYY